MINLRVRYLCAIAAAVDATLVFGGVPLQRYSWTVATQPSPDATLVLMLIGANVLLLGVALCGVCVSTALARRGVRIVARHAARFFARPSRA